MPTTAQTAANGAPKPDPADDRPPPGDTGTPQRPPPRVEPSPGTGAVAEAAGADTARLADVPRAARSATGDAHLEDDSRRPGDAHDADAVRHRSADRGISAAIAGVDIVPSEDR